MPRSDMLQWFSKREDFICYEIFELYKKLAHALIDELPEAAESTVALRKLLESRDAAIRAEM